MLATVLTTAPIHAATTQVGQELVGEGGRYGQGGLHQLGAAVALSDDGSRMLVGAMSASDGDDGPVFAGRVRVLDLIGGRWEDVGQPLYGGERLQGFGAAVAMTAPGTRIAVSSNAQVTVGKVQVFDLVGEEWVQVGGDIDGVDEADLFGQELALTADGSRLVIAAPSSSIAGEDSGFVRAFNLIDGAWVQVGDDLIGRAGDHFGTALAVSDDGSLLAIGAWGESSRFAEGGQAQVFRVEQGTWQSFGDPIVAENDGDHVGRSLALTGDGSRLVVGSLGPETGSFDRGGRIRVFDWVEGQWVRVGSTIEGERLTSMGYQVSIDEPGNRIVASSFGTDDSFAGDVRIFDFVNSEWREATGNQMGGSRSAGYFGGAIALSADGSRLVVGEPRASGERGFLHGRVRAYTLDVASPICGGREATIVGTPGDDVILGSTGIDVIIALQGNDIIRGLGGDDIICAGKGDDVVYGGRDFDIIFGAQGNDVLYSSNGDTELERDDSRGARMFGGAGDDQLFGSTRWDRMQGGPGADSLTGFEGRDWIRGGADSDTIEGGPNIDDVHGGNGSDLIVVEGDDAVRGGAGALDRCVLLGESSPVPLISCERRT